MLQPGQIWLYYDKDSLGGIGSKWFIHSTMEGDFEAGAGEYVKNGCHILTLKMFDNQRSPSSDFVLALHLPSSSRIRIPSFYFFSDLHKCFHLCP